MRIVIIRLSALGDILTATPLARLIKKHHPASHLTWVVEERWADAVRGNPDIDEVLAIASSRQWRHWARHDRRRLYTEARHTWRALRGVRCDVILDVHGLAKSALPAKAMRAPRKIRPAVTTERVPGVYNEFAPVRPRPEYITSIYTSLAESLGCVADEPADFAMHLPVSPAAHEFAREWLAAHDLAPGGYVVCAPGTTWAHKHWRAERWAPALDALYARSGRPTVFLGGPSEAELVAGLRAAMTTPSASAVGACTVPQSGALLAAAALCLTVDTGPMHMAVAVGCPTVAIYGPTPPRLFGPAAPYVPLYAQVACSPCWRRPTCAGTLDCMQAITVEQVVAAGLHLLGAEIATL